MAPTIVWSCPSCSLTMNANHKAEKKELVSGYQYSIMIMLGMPVILIGGIAFVIAKSVRTKNKINKTGDKND